MFLIKEFQETDKKGLIILVKEQLNIKKSSENSNIEKRVENLLRISQQSSLLVAIDSNAGVIGYVLIQWLCELWTDFPEAFISNFYVKQDFRQLGAGTSLLKVAIQEATKRQCQRVFLENNRNNPVYQSQFYLKRGWKEREDIAIFEFSEK